MNEKPRTIDAVRIVLICRDKYGLTAQQAARVAGVGVPTARRALQSLERGNMAKATRKGRTLVYLSMEQTLLDWVWR